MILRKPALLASSYSHIHVFYCPSSGLSSTSIAQSPNHPLTNSCQSKPRRRKYATVQGEKPSDRPEDLEWPQTSSVPTPYQILHLHPRAHYTKHTFYKLVKIYHPDRTHCQGPDEVEKYGHIHRLPGSLKMERYRLVVAAHEILSDPTKRRAYDRYGSGWNGRLSHEVFTSSWRQSQENPSETKWSGFDTNDSPFRNATWEDWERWYNRHRVKPQPLYASNGAFVSLVALALLVGGVAQGMQVDKHTEFYNEQAEKRHQIASRALQQHRAVVQESTGDVEERVTGFLRAREGGGYGFGEGGERRNAREPVLCLSDGVLRRKAARNIDESDSG